MYQPRFDQILPSEKFYPYMKWFSFAFATLLIFSCLLFMTAPVHGAQTHSCAPDPPAPVSGNLITTPSTPGIVMINEVLSLPHANWNCSEPAGVYSPSNDSWVELYNTQSQPLDLYAAHAQISVDGGNKWLLLPFGSQIPPNGFLVIFPLEHSQNVPATATWTVILEIPGTGTVIDQAAIPALQADQSYARIPDGSSNWQYVGQPTIDASNDNSNQPVTPTPTKTPAPTKTPTSTKTPKPPSSGSTSGNSGANAPASSGTQPAWNGVQVPTGDAPTPAATDSSASTTQLLSQSQTQNTQTTPGGGQDGWWHNMVLVVLVLLLLVVFVCCWRLFRAP